MTPFAPAPARFNPPRGHLLEFGSAYGFFLSEAAPHFDRASGIELCEDAVSFAASRGLDVARGVVEPATLPDGIDVAVGLDVIEQRSRAAGDRPAPRGTPSVGRTIDALDRRWASLLARAMGPKWRLLTPPQHLSFFTPRSMRRMLENAVLRVLELSHPWKQVPLAYRLQRMAGRPPASSETLKGWGIPLNLFDAMRVVARK